MSTEYDYTLLQSFGKKIFISKNVEIRRPKLVTIGKNVAIDTGFYCTVKAEIGDYVHIGPYVTIIGGKEGYFKMGHFTTIGAGSRIICVSYEYQGVGLVGPTIPTQYQDNRITAKVTIEDFAGIGTNVVVFPGVRLAQGSVVGAGSLVTVSTEPWTIYVGNPARPIKSRRKDIMIKMAHKLGY